MHRTLIAALAATAMLGAGPATAASPEGWAKWADRADGLSSYLEGLTPGNDGKIEIGEGARRACRGADTQITFGGYPKWAAYLASICDTYGAMGGGKINAGKGCKLLRKWAAELGKGEPVAEAPRVEPARLRLLAQIEGACAKR